MNKIVYNACYGGFSISKEAVLLGRKLSGNPSWGDCTLAGETYSDGSVRDSMFGDDSNYPTLARHDPILVQVVETLGSKKASGECAKLKIYETSEKLYNIDEYDGFESVETESTHVWTIIE